MQIKIFTVHVENSEIENEMMNKFLRSHRILKVDHAFSPDNGGYWTFAVHFLDGDSVEQVPPADRKHQKVDYAEILNEEEMSRFNKYRGIRADLSRKLGLSAFLIFTNAELAELARLPVLNNNTLKDVKNVNAKRLNDFVNDFMERDGHEESGEPDAADS